MPVLEESPIALSKPAAAPSPVTSVRSERSNLVAKHDRSSVKTLKPMRRQFGKNYYANLERNSYCANL